MSTNDKSENLKFQPDPNTYSRIDDGKHYSDESHYRSEFTNISSLNTYPHGNYINDYNTIYSNEEYGPSIELKETKLNYLDSSANQTNNYAQLRPEDYLKDSQYQQLNDYQLNQQQQQNSHFQLQQPPLQFNQPPPYQQSEYSRSTDYIVNTPYSPGYPDKVKQKSFFARFCGQLISIFLVIFMLLLSFLLIRSFQAGLTSNAIARHNQQEWRKHDK